MRAWRRLVEAEQVVPVVQQHVEVIEKILAQNSANVKIDRLEILEAEHEHLLVRDGMGTGFDQVELRGGSGCLKSHACDRRGALHIQMEFSGQRGIDDRGLRSRIQQEVVGAGMVDRNRDD
jgi:hypothetical protein